MKLTHDRAAYMTVSELADELGVHRNTVLYWIRQGTIESRRMGISPRSPLLIPRRELARVKDATGQDEVELY